MTLSEIIAIIVLIAGLAAGVAVLRETYRDAPEESDDDWRKWQW